MAEEAGREVQELIVPLFHEVLIKDADLRFLYVNDVFAMRFGVSPEQAIGKTDFDFFTTEVAEMYREADRRAIQEGVLTTAESLWTDDSGEERIYSIAKFPVKDRTGEVVALVCVADSATYRRKAERTLSHWASVVMSSTDAVMALGLDGTVQSWNPGAERMYGYTADEMQNRPVTVLVPEAEQPEVEQVIARAAKGESTIDHQAQHAMKDGRRIWVALSMSPVWDTQGSVTAISAIGHDVTDRVRMEKELKDSLDRLARFNTELGHFAYAASHERPKRTPHREAVEEVARQVRADPIGDFDFEAAADDLHMSYSHFRRLFRHCTGHSPHDYLLLWRMRAAARLLRDPNRPVKAVAGEIGYPDPNQFSKLFKRKIGVSPTEYREALLRQ
jgi:PAS domain S-box-containing protein